MIKEALALVRLKILRDVAPFTSQLLQPMFGKGIVYGSRTSCLTLALRPAAEPRHARGPQCPSDKCTGNGTCGWMRWQHYVRGKDACGRVGSRRGCGGSRRGMPPAQVSQGHRAGGHCRGGHCRGAGQLTAENTAPAPASAVAPVRCVGPCHRASLWSS